MAYQPKSYRKFVATTATAAMVASAVAPVVSAAAGFTDVAPQYKDAIDFLVSTGATNGKTDTKFGVYDEITRLDAAVILAKVLKLDVDNAKDAGFTDVPKDRAKYVNALVDAGVLSGKAPGKFGAYDKLTRVEMAKIIANAYNLKGDDVTLPFTDVNDTWAPFVKALYKNGVTKGKTETSFGAYQNITRGDFAVFVYRAANVDVEPEAPQVVSVSAINVNKIKVTFNKAVDTTKAKFEVKRGTVTEDVKVTWNEAKTEAVLEKTAGNFTPAEYTVTVSGIEGLENATNTVKVEAEVVKSIEIVNTQLQKSSNAPLNVKFINQYGEEATVSPSDVTITAYNKTNSARAVTPVNGKFQLNASAAEVKDEVQVTVYYKGLTVTKTLTVVNPATVGSVTLTEAVLPTGKTFFTPSGTKDVEIKYTAQDIYGEKYDLTANDVANGAIKFFSSDSEVLNVSDISITDDNKIKIAKFGKAGTVTLTVLSTATGQTSQLTIEVKEDAGKPYSVELDKTDLTVAQPTAEKKVYLTPTVKDQYGTVITAKDLKAEDYTIAVSNKSVVSDAKLVTEAGEHQGQIELTIPANAPKTSATVTVTVNSTGQKATANITIGEAATPTSIVVEKDFNVPTALLAGAQKTLKFDVNDQYGNLFDGTSDYTVAYTTSDDTVLALSNPSADEADPSVVVKALKAGTVTIKAQLKDKNGVVVAEKALTIQVIANDSTKVSYSIPAIAPIYKKAVVTTPSDDTEKKAAVDSGYAEEVAINATDASGNVTLVPTSAVVGTPSITLKDAQGNDVSDKIGIFEYDGKYYLYTQTDFAADDFKKADGTTTDLTGTISFTINADDTVKVVTQSFTVSKDDAKVQSIAFKDKPYNDPEADKATDVTAFELANAADYADAGNKTVYVWAKDQFGGYAAAADTVRFSLANVKGVDGIANDTVDVDPDTGVITIEDNPSGSADTVFTVNNAAFRLIAQANGQTDFVTFTVADGVLPTAAATGAVSVKQATTGTYAANDTITIKFSEKVKVANLVGTNGAPQNILIQGGTGATLDASTIAAADADSNGYATTFVITLKGSPVVASGDKLVVTANKVEDVVGNTASADVEFLLP
ncbi:S-layer homology domain-containing protein [Parageobacillus sp. VR-IP]|uniref:S-layer homology domain-containing protein n=1 Tax=Parageobacillus sp. VR-IP TaxID=2742205 RepID=UPI001581609D|nr:S-layer homology domain-containing protein [Parageobacillus sp. VR-IP]NUK29802.1 S-layer homology domain-containing protein [Parageobacillus sp. VR-IP]